MKKVLKWVGIILLAIIVIAAILVFYFKSSFEKNDTRRYDMEVTSIPIPDDSLSLERGRVLAEGCKGCHGGNFDGLDFFNDEALGYMASPNISSAKGSATEKYSDDDWVRALRHGLNPVGRPLMVMPSGELGKMSDEDLGSLIAFFKQIKPIEKEMGESKFSLMMKVLAGTGMMGELYAYNKIDHEAVRSIASIPISTNEEYGFYLAEIHACTECHGKTLNGGVSPDPVSPAVPNITNNSRSGKWTSDQFIETMRTGITPEGKVMDAKFMPWPGIAAHDSIELTALYNFVRSMPGLEDHKSIEGKIVYD